MDRPSLQTLDMLMRVREFGIHHASIFAAEPAFAPAFAAVAKAVDELTVLHSTQAGERAAGNTATTDRTRIRERLTRKLERIRRSALLFADEVPTVRGLFVPPRSNGDRAVLSTARAFAESAEPYAAHFAANLLTKAFFDDFASDIAALDEALAARGQWKTNRASVTASVAEAVRRGRLAVQKLDTLIANQFGTPPPSLVAAWQAASRVYSARSRGPSAAPMPESVERRSDDHHPLAPAESAA